MQKNLIISLVIGQLVALLPIWDWGDKPRIIKRALTSANVKGLRN